MSCRVGMSTDPEERISYWMKKEGYTDYQILEEGLTYDEAQTSESFYAELFDCDSGEGGYPSDKRNEPVWYVYYLYD